MKKTGRRIINIDGHEILCEVIRSGRKTMAVQIKQDGTAVIRLPYRASESDMKALLDKSAGWILKHIAEIQKERAESREGPEPLSVEQIKNLADAAKKYIPGRVEHYSGKIGVSYGRITIRCQKTRWGSCSSKGNLNFSCLLMLTPPEVIDSVVVHELCHRKEMNHSKKFYDEVYRVFPDYDKWHGWLKDNGREIIKRIPG